MVNLEKVLVLGIGNYLMGDEGVGVHCIHKLKKIKLPDNVEVVDGGTGGFHLLSYLSDNKIIIMIDATMDGKEEGQVCVIQPKFASDFPRALSAHDIGLRDLVESAVITGKLPKIYLIVISISSVQNMEINLSLKVNNSIPVVIDKVKEIIEFIHNSAG
ncbi:hydrogenase 2 maturation protease [bacterium BMS3Abin04]|nr:hydrogenase 2 maturation protease [bacterium BMS3Abin04]